MYRDKLVKHENDVNILGGVVARFFFRNGYAGSVISGSGCYGGERGLHELAVLKGTPEDWRLCYDTPITDDVLGWLDWQQVEDLLNQISELPDAEEEDESP